MSFPPVADRLTRLPDVDEAKRAPLQSVEPAGRKTMVLPAEAKDPRTCTVVRVLAGMAEGLKSMSGGIGGGGEGEGGGGGDGGGGDGAGGGGGGVAGGPVAAAQIVNPPAMTDQSAYHVIVEPASMWWP